MYCVVSFVAQWRHGNMLGAKETFFYKLVGPLIDVMGSAGEDLKRQQAQVEQVLKTEEEQFAPYSGARSGVAG
ncbi:alanyl-tRNA synthetase [Escherichia coli]|uniref:Alanyl-tRNA synthetase n=1 Tax=Escherichia coli TaxID=562 RepID=A0A377BYQ8_ECOLX|nr:alanyl-tRNA synthetase [Escherichia coli]